MINKQSLEQLLSLIGDDKDTLKELIEEFAAEAPRLANDITQGCAAADVDKVRIAAHTLKSNAADLGATELSALCHSIEHTAKQGSVDTVGELSTSLIELTAKSVQALSSTDITDLV